MASDLLTDAFSDLDVNSALTLIGQLASLVAGRLAPQHDTSEAPPPSPVQPNPAFHFEGRPEARPLRKARPPLPDPRLVRKILRHRHRRAHFFDGGLFADPAWDMLLDLTAARVEHRRVSVTSLCLASGVPPTTALRWVGEMADAGLLNRTNDDADRRRVFVSLTDGAADAMARYFADAADITVPLF